MPLILDHLYILTPPGAAAADRLVEAGFREGPGNVHPGQGTANRRFFFRDFMLELLWVADTDEARNGVGRELRLADRATAPEASPFGVVFVNPGGEPPFLGWRYAPDYLPGGLQFHIGANSDQLAEPLCVVMPPFPPPAGIPDEQRFDAVRSVELSIAQEQLSPTLTAAADATDRLQVVSADAPLASITFANDQGSGELDLRPHLPLHLHW